LLQQQNILVLSTKRVVAAAKFLVATTKNLFVAVTKPFFLCIFIPKTGVGFY